MSSKVSLAQATRLRAAAFEMLAIADELERSTPQRRSGLPFSETVSPRSLAALATKHFADRELRKSYINDAFFGEPAWDMLLYLFIKSCASKRVYKTAVTSASGVPHSTALRYLELLERDELLRVEPAEGDKRVQLVSLTQKGSSAMADYLSRSIQIVRQSLPEFEADRETSASHPMYSIEPHTFGPDL